MSEWILFLFKSYGVTLFVKKDVPGMHAGDHMVCMMCPICKKLFMYAELGPHLVRTGFVTHSPMDAGDLAAELGCHCIDIHTNGESTSLP